MRSFADDLHDVELWAAELGGDPVEPQVWLDRGSVSAEDVARASEFHRTTDRDRSLLASRLLREAVHSWRRHLGAPDGDVEVVRSCPDCDRPHGRPVVVGGPHVSVTHSGRYVVVALCATSEVGVDVEPLERADEALALGPVLGLPENEATPHGALRRWIRLEAALKSTGEGLRREPSDWEVTQTGDDRGFVSDRSGGDARAFRDLGLPGALGAVATARGRVGRVTTRGPVSVSAG